MEKTNSSEPGKKRHPAVPEEEITALLRGCPVRVSAAIINTVPHEGRKEETV